MKMSRRLELIQRSVAMLAAFVAAMFCGSAAIGDELPYWRDSVSGRLYWNKHRPVYLFLAPSPSGADSELLQSERMPKYACPFYFDTEGVNYLRTRWAVDTSTKQAIRPQQEILWEVYADGLPPTTRTHITGKSKKEKARWMLSGESSVTLTATDAGSGVAEIYYTLDSSHWECYSSPITLSNEVPTTLHYYAVDHVGNREATRSLSLCADLTPPTSQCVVVGPYLASSNTVAATSVLHLESHDQGVGVEKVHYRLNGGQWTSGKPGTRVEIAKLADGDHTIEFYGTDYVGNEEAVQSFSFYLDKTPPITISDILGDKFIVGDKTYFSGRSKMKITAVDNKAGVKAVRYSIDGGAFQPYEAPFYMPNKPGWHVVKYYSIDSMENQTEGLHADEYYEYRMKVDKIYVDLTGPRIYYSVTGDRYTRNDTVYLSPRSQITLRGEDDESGLQKLTYTLDHAPEEYPFEKAISFEGLGSGEHYAEFFAYDQVNNRNVKTLTFFIDSDAPRVDYKVSVEALTKAGEVKVYPRDAKVYLTSQDDITGVSLLEYSLNGSALQPYRGAIGGLKAGSNTLRVRATDKVGNTQETTWEIECR